jgi:hypothetical protein
MAAASYKAAPEAAEMAAELIREHHPHLDGVRIEFLFRSDCAKKHGKAVLGSASLVTGKNALLATDPDRLAEDRGLYGKDYMPEFFVIEIAEPAWQSFDEKQRKALVDHELCHCDVIEDDSGTKLAIKGHDMEEFKAIYQRYGCWLPDRLEFAKVVHNALQAELPALHLERASDGALSRAGSRVRGR